jgi:hypothetical protein
MNHAAVDSKDGDYATGNGRNPGGQPVQSVANVDGIRNSDNPQQRDRAAQPPTQGDCSSSAKANAVYTNARKTQYAGTEYFYHEFEAGWQPSQVINQANQKNAGGRAEQRDHLESHLTKPLANEVVQEKQ